MLEQVPAQAGAIRKHFSAGDFQIFVWSDALQLAVKALYAKVNRRVAFEHSVLLACDMPKAVTIAGRYAVIGSAKKPIDADPKISSPNKND